jgi:hypothetical protein
MLPLRILLIAPLVLGSPALAQGTQQASGTSRKAPSAGARRLQPNRATTRFRIQSARAFRRPRRPIRT